MADRRTHPARRSVLRTVQRLSRSFLLNCGPGPSIKGMERTLHRQKYQSPTTHSSPAFACGHSGSLDGAEAAGHIGRRGIGLSGSYRQGYSTAYNARSHIKVVCNGYILAHVSNYIPRGPRRDASVLRGIPALYDAGHGGLFVFSLHARGRTSPLSGTDSDLEAFSHYPADGSFAALPGRAAAKANYLNQRFLSY
jgi:hypothetical protein